MDIRIAESIIRTLDQSDMECGMQSITQRAAIREAAGQPETWLPESESLERALGEK